MSIKVDEDSVLNPESSNLTLNPNPEFFTVNCEAITIIEVSGRVTTNFENGDQKLIPKP